MKTVTYDETKFKLVPVERPKATGENAKGGWKLDFAYLERLSYAAADEDGRTSLEQVEAILLAADRDAVAERPPAPPEVWLCNACGSDNQPCFGACTNCSTERPPPADKEMNANGRPTTDEQQEVKGRAIPLLTAEMAAVLAERMERNYSMPGSPMVKALRAIADGRAVVVPAASPVGEPQNCVGEANGKRCTLRAGHSHACWDNGPFISDVLTVVGEQDAVDALLREAREEIQWSRDAAMKCNLIALFASLDKALAKLDAAIHERESDK